MELVFLLRMSRLKCDLRYRNCTLCLVCQVDSWYNEEDIASSKATAISFPPLFKSLCLLPSSSKFPFFCTVGLVKKLAMQNWYFKFMENSRTWDSTRFIIFSELFLLKSYEEDVVNIWTSVSLKFWGYVDLLSFCCFYSFSSFCILEEIISILFILKWLEVTFSPYFF